jgi:nucleoside-diphosphate-sugar epimerase
MNSIARQSSSRPILILGGSGFIGTRLVRLLTHQGVPVRIGDIKPSADFPNLFTYCDVRDQVSVMAAARGASAIVNLAAEHRDDVRPISLYHDVNVSGASNVCPAARQAGIQKIIFTSSVAVYGFQSRPVDENGSFAPFNAYGKTKLEAEKIYRGWAAEDVAKTLVIVRPTVVFGEGNRGNVYNLLQQVAAGRFLMVGSGDNVKSMAYVGNVVSFLVHSLSLPAGEHIFNYVDTPDMSTRELVTHIKRSLSMDEKTTAIPMPVALACGYVMDGIARLTGRRFPISAIRVRKFCASTQFRADRVVQSGFVAPYSLRDAVARTVQFEFPVARRSSRAA